MELSCTLFPENSPKLLKAVSCTGHCSRLAALSKRKNAVRSEASPLIKKTVIHNVKVHHSQSSKNIWARRTVNRIYIQKREREKIKSSSEHASQSENCEWWRLHHWPATKWAFIVYKTSTAPKPSRPLPRRACQNILDGKITILLTCSVYIKYLYTLCCGDFIPLPRKFYA